MYSYSIFYYLATCGPKGHVSGSIYFSVFNHIPSPTTCESYWGSISAKKDDKRENKRKRKNKTKQNRQFDLFGANGGSRPSMDGLTSTDGLAFPTKMKTFWVIKYLNIYSTNK